MCSGRHANTLLTLQLGKSLDREALRPPSTRREPHRVGEAMTPRLPCPELASCCYPAFLERSSGAGLLAPLPIAHISQCSVSRGCHLKHGPGDVAGPILVLHDRCQNHQAGHLTDEKRVNEYLDRVRAAPVDSVNPRARV